MRSTGAVGALSVLVLVLALGTYAEAQLAKQGTYSSHFGWYAIGKTFELEKDHTLFVGEFSGANFNEAGAGFLHHASRVNGSCRSVMPYRFS